MIEKGYYKRNNGSEAFLRVVDIHESGDPICVWGFTTLLDDRTSFRYHHHEFEKEFVAISEEEVNKLERQRCPRREEGVFSLEKDPLPDFWDVRANGDKTCSFCGSLHPESVIEILKKNGFGCIERSTKNYKWYINRPEVHNAGGGGIKYYRQHDTEKFIAEYNSLLDESKKDS